MITKNLFFSILLIIVMLTSLTAHGGGQMGHSYLPEKGFVPDEKTAIAIAEAVLVPIYGEEKINGQKPFVVSLSENVWVVEGTLKGITLGGVFRIEISKSNGEILRVTHGK